MWSGSADAQHFYVWRLGAGGEMGRVVPPLDEGKPASYCAARAGAEVWLKPALLLILHPILRGFLGLVDLLGLQGFGNVLQKFLRGGLALDGGD